MQILDKIIENEYITDRLKRMDEEKYFIQEYQNIFNIHSENNQYWIVRIRGPEGSPFEGFWYRIRIDFPQDYPYDPPIVTFITPIQHPFISDQGDIYLDQYLIYDNWDLYIRIYKILKTIRNYLGKQHYELGIRIKSTKEIADQYQNDYNVYLQNARQFAQQHGEQQ